MDDNYIIREFNVEDLDEVIIIWNSAFNAGYSSSFDNKEKLIKYLERNKGLSTVCEKDGKVIGALLCGHDGRRGSIYNTAVLKDYQKQGIGRKMEQRALDELRKEGIHTGFLFINVKNPGSKEFWQSIGWEVIDDIKYLYKQF